MKVNLKLEGCNLEITGTYSKAEPDVGLQASFEIEKIHTRDDLYLIFDWLQSGNNFRDLEEKIIEQIENDEPDYEEEDD